ncbi:TRAP transporter small permease [Solirhodobacter olei]|uniref:TRAP transporter small permease n=1 Tax=Solirhodobacter olei TaxID=2493082 RepID=UPI000FD9A014|nr:TRAP transporter small permease [Solirhodobacter olei]
MLRTLGRLQDALVLGALVLSSTLIGVAILLVVVDVSLRALRIADLNFTVAFVEYILLYFVLLAAPYLVRERGHVVADMIHSRMTGTPRLVMEKLIYIVCILVSLVFAWSGLMLLIGAIQNGYIDERSVNIPYWLLYIWYPPCFVLIAIEFARFLFGHGSYFEKHDNLESL